MHGDRDRERRFVQLTVRRVEIMGLVEQQFIQAQIAKRLHIKPSTVHSHIRELEALYRCDNMGDLGRCWTEDKEPWVDYLARKANVRWPK